VKFSKHFRQLIAGTPNQRKQGDAQMPAVIKQTALFVSVSAFFVFVGCNDHFKPSATNNNNNVIHCPVNAKCINFPDGYVSMRFTEPTQLGTVLGSLDPSQKIFRMTVLENGGGTQMIAFNQAYNDTPSILREYKKASDEMSQGLLLDLQYWYDKSSDESLRQEIDRVNEKLALEPDSTLLILQASVLED